MSHEPKPPPLTWKEPHDAISSIKNWADAYPSDRYWFLWEQFHIGDYPAYRYGLASRVNLREFGQGIRVVITTRCRHPRHNIENDWLFTDTTLDAILSAVTALRGTPTNPDTMPMRRQEEFNHLLGQMRGLIEAILRVDHEETNRVVVDFVKTYGAPGLIDREGEVSRHENGTMWGWEIHDGSVVERINFRGRLFVRGIEREIIESGPIWRSEDHGGGRGL
jgi:hypothetical protein